MRKEKKRKGKRILAAMLAAALVFGAVSAGPSISVKAAETGEETGGEGDASPLDSLEWNTDRTRIISDGSFTGTTLDLRGSGVTVIGASAFLNNKNLVTIYLPETLESIGKDAFYHCSALNKVVFEEDSKLTSIGNSAFSGCSALNKVIFEGKSELNGIGDSAFFGCDKLTEFSLPDPVDSIGKSAFSGCSALNKVVFGKNAVLTTIKDSAFYNCNKLPEITLPDSVETIGNYAFQGCSALNKLVFGENPALKKIQNSAFSGCGITEFTLPGSVETIGKSAFSSCSALVNVDFNANSKLKSIEDSTFYNCGMTEITLPASVATIGNNAFQSCSALNKVVFREGSILKSIGNNAFRSCNKLPDFTLPDLVESIGEDAFYFCSSLKQFNIGENSSLKIIQASAFSGCSALTGEICFPASLESFGDSALSGSTKLTAVTFKNKDTTLGKNVFPDSGDPDKNVVFYSEPDGSVEIYARAHNIHFQRPSSSFTVKNADGEPLDEPLVFFYGDTINAEVLQQEGVKAFAEFDNKTEAEIEAGGEGEVDLRDCILSDLDTTKVGDHNIRVNYFGSLYYSVPIKVYYDMSTAKVNGIGSKYTYTGLAIEPEFSVGLTAGKTTLPLVKDRDYTADWTDNVNKGMATLTLTGMESNNYKGTKQVNFEIGQKSIGGDVEVHVESETVEYTGNAVEPRVTVTLGDKTLVKDTDYTVAYTDNVEPGTARVTVTCKGNYSGTAYENFKIIRDISKDAEITLTDADFLEYTGDEIMPQIRVTLGGVTLGTAYYTVTYKNNVLPGENTASVVVTGTGAYSGSVEKKFTIHPKDIQDTMTVNLAQTSFTYTGAEQKPKVTVYDGDPDYGKMLREGTDYTLTYADNTDVGTASVTVTCIGLYAGEKVEEFTITPMDISEKAEVSLAEDELEYTGEALTPEATVVIGRDELAADRDFKVQYKNNIQAGTAEVSVIGQGNYSGTITKTFQIFNDISGKMKVAFVEDELEYTGKPIIPSFTVAWGGTVLMPQEDFDVSYQNNTNVGLAQVKVVCKGKYRGEAVASFTITKRDITDEMDCILSYDEAEATGTALTPGVTVRLGRQTLVADVDYTVKYADNVNPGTATVTVTAKGNYEGTAVLNFTINKPATSDPSETEEPTATPDPSETEEPTATPDPSGTEDPTATPDPSQPENPTVTPDPSQPDPSQPGATQPGVTQPDPSQPGAAQPGTPSVPSVADDADDDDSDDADGAKPGKVKNLKAKNDKKKTLTLTWKSIQNAKSYQIQYSTSKKFKGSKTKVSNKAKATVKGLKKKTTYYIRVRACAVSDGKKVYGAWSAVKKVKIKK